jgi:hypothetical protein
MHAHLVCRCPSLAPACSAAQPSCSPPLPSMFGWLQAEKKWRVHVGLHVLVAYMKKGYQCECLRAAHAAVTWRQRGGGGGVVLVDEPLTLRVLLPAVRTGLPFDKNHARSQQYVVGHMCECVRRTCATPWHVDIVTHRQNTMSGQWVRRHRGEHANEHVYGFVPPDCEESDEVRVGGCVGWVAGWRARGERWRYGADMASLASLAAGAPPKCCSTC